MGAQLTVRENQVRCSSTRARRDLFKPGRYELSTQNMPVMTTLRSWKYGFDSPFRPRSTFSTRVSSPTSSGARRTRHDARRGVGMIRMRAFGTYAIKISDPKEFFKPSGLDRASPPPRTSSGSFGPRSSATSRTSWPSKIAALDLASSYRELATLAQKNLAPEFASYGSISRGSTSTTSRFRKKWKRPSTSAPNSASSATSSVRTRRCRPRNRSKSPRPIRAAWPDRRRPRRSMAIGQTMAGAFNAPQGSYVSNAAGSAAPPPPPGALRRRPRVAGHRRQDLRPVHRRRSQGDGEQRTVPSSTQAWRPARSGWAALETYSELGLGSGTMPPPPPPPQ